MSTKHVTHNILTPGLPGDGFTAPEATAARRKLETVTAVSADWYSDLNDAITAAGVGGRVVLSPGVEYAQDDPLLVLDNLTIEGDSRYGSVIKYTGAAAVQAPNFLTGGIVGFRMFNITLDGDSVGGMGIDARSFSQSHFDMVRIWNPTSHGVWWGGDGDYHGGWSNSFKRGEVRGPMTGDAMRFEGRAGGSGGAPTANDILVEACTIFTRESPNSNGVNIVNGDSNVFFANDCGYGIIANAAYRLGSNLAERNRFIANRTENIERAVLIEGGQHNMFAMNSFGLRANANHHGAEIYSGSDRNVFLHNWWDAKGLGPRVWEDAGPGAYNTIIDDLSPAYGLAYGNTATDPRGAIHSVSDTGSFGLGVKAKADSQPRWFTSGGGTQWFGSGSGNPDVSLERIAANTLATGTGDKMIARGGLGSSSLVAVTGTLGTLIRRMPIYDETGAFIGYIPVYNNIT